MNRIVRTVVAVGALAGLTGCLASVASYPVIDDTPNPTPVRGYRVQCRTIPLLLDEHFTTCEPVLGPAQEIVRARG